MPSSIRLSKRLVELIACSRREAELYIAGGWVSVEGQVVEEPQFMVDEQKVELHPNAKLVPVEPVTILFNQSSEVEFSQDAITAETQWPEDHSGTRILKQHFFKLTQCLPLEPNATGLMVFTQDFRVSRKLSSDASTIEQEYVVDVAGELIADGLQLLSHGLSYNGKALPPIKVSWQNETRLRFALKGVQSGQILHVCKSVGLEVKAIKRLRIGRVSMGKLPAAQWRYLLGYERF